MRKILEKYDKFEKNLLILSLFVNTIIVFMQVIMRSVFNASISWSEEMSRYIFIWQIWMGTSIAFKSNQHIKVDLIYNIFKSKRAHKIIETIVDLIWLIFNVFLCYVGFKLLVSMNARGALSSGMRLPLVYVYLALPLSSLILSIRIVLSIFDKFTKNTVEEVK